MTAEQPSHVRSIVESRSGRTKNRRMVAQGKPTIIVPHGFNWAAMLFGPFWAAFKAFWPAAIALAVINFGLRFVAREVSAAGFSTVALSITVVHIGVTVVVGFYANELYAAYLAAKGYKVSAEPDKAAPERVVS
ncbi:MAG: DUF2628 domain-containing protein [Rhodocyclaceae bacterium]|jgi:hypothetical protein|nr:DUF2628 domain-containing protein [Rhodocyclaceae bacterium]MCE2722979.1 DUF2628 domain-containing protein [Betaproteobacteria bacterium]MCA3031164.1 DUF2628 domain-containing protein [Rhodocyclaceae bacterium]MCA3038588.1 DUF2628 domain-containing protein [Rhodocyclaceae bacterium]MCA3040656.1 DUF2628 domain-containing protein [Rhodocyclaceae bacterium]